MFKLPNVEWSWLVNHRRKYANGPRGNMIKRFNIELVADYEPGKYDIVVLHLDQQCLEPTLWERGKGSLYRELNEVITDVPKVLIMHGTPYYPEAFSCDITEENYEEMGFTKDQVGMSSELIKRFREVAMGNTVVCNSHKAAKQWGIGEAIIHGMDPDEWWDLPKEPRIVTMISPGGLDQYYDRTFLAAVKEELADRDIEHCHITVDAQFKNWDEYRDFLGRSLLYFNPTRESCMPRARTEAMLSGCCVLTTPHQDADTFIKQGENGYLIRRNPVEVADLAEKLIQDYKTAIEIGQKGKQTALEKFSQERYQKNWADIIYKVTKKII